MFADPLPPPPPPPPQAERKTATTKATRNRVVKTGSKVLPGIGDAESSNIQSPGFRKIFCPLFSIDLPLQLPC